MKRSALLLALTAVAGAPAVAQPSVSSQPVQVTAKADKPEDKVACRTINTTGSRLLGERVCKTRAQWAAESDRTREEFENGPRRPSGDQLTPIDPN
jgi:hypothetical protein